MKTNTNPDPSQHVHDLSVSINVNEVPVAEMDNLQDALKAKMAEVLAELGYEDAHVGVDDGRSSCDDWEDHYIR